MAYETEIWKPIPQFDGYEASNFGMVRSLPKVVFTRHRGFVGTRLRGGKILARVTHHSGYLIVRLRRNDGKFQNLTVHQAVARAFHGLPPEGMVVAHKNNTKTDNRPENLEYMTNSDNVKCAHRDGLMPVTREKALANKK